MKKILCMLLTITMVVSLSACGGGTTGTTPGTPSTSGTPSASGTPASPITLTVGVPASTAVTDWENNDLTKMVEKKTGYNIEFVYFSSTADEYKTQLAVQVAGDEQLPDILLNLNLDASLRDAYGADGIFVDLNQFYKNEEFMSQFEWYQLFTSGGVDQDVLDRFWIEGLSADGSWWAALSEVGDKDIDTNSNMVYINSTWLDKLGLEKPDTLDEFKTVLTAFKTQDPNGNGKADEIPVLGTTNIGRGYIDLWLINNFEYVHHTYPYNIGEDGKVYSPYVTDAYREGIKAVRDLYDAGLISELTWTIKDRAEIQALVNPAGGVCTLGVWAGHAHLNFSTDSPTLYEYEGLPPFQGACAPLNPSKLTFNNYITTDCANPEAAFRLLMAYGEADAIRQQRYGTENVDWHWDTDFETKAQGLVIDNADAFAKSTSTTYAFTVNMIYWPYSGADTGSKPVPPAKLATPTDPSQGLSWSDYREVMCNNTHCIPYWAAAAENNPKKVAYTLVYTEEETEQRNDPHTLITDYVKQARAEFCTGTRDINDDTAWEAYKKDLENMGLNILIQTAQAAWDRANG